MHMQLPQYHVLLLNYKSTANRIFTQVVLRVVCSEVIRQFVITKSLVGMHLPILFYSSNIVACTESLTAILGYVYTYVTGPVKIDHVSAKIANFFYHNLTIYTTATKSSLVLQNLMGFLLQLTAMRYYILNGRY